MSDRVPLTLAHSPDPDDAFMWWPLTGLGGGPCVETGLFDFELVTDDIESLNQQAESRRHDITAVSIAHYPAIRDHYILTACGASVGDGYGPKLITRGGVTLDGLRRDTPIIAVPGERTTALACSRLLLGDGMQFEAIPFDQIEDAVESGQFLAGVVIHEGQLTCEGRGLEILVDLGAWWQETRGLLLPLGGNVAARDLETLHGPGTLSVLARVLRDSVRYAMEHREQSLEWALQFGRGIDLSQADRFVEMYVNKWTLDFGDDGRLAVQTFLNEAAGAHVVRPPGIVDFASPAASGSMGNNVGVIG